MKLQKKINEICLIAALSLVTLCTAWSVPPPVDNSAAPITPGQWHSDLTKAKTYSEQNNIPLLYVWGVSGCAASGKLDNYLNTPAFTSWAAARKLVMVYVKAPDTTATPDKQFAKAGLNGKLTEYPMVAVYWKSKNVQPANFSGRYPVISDTVGAQQFMAEVEFYVGSYVTPVPYLDWTIAESIPLVQRGYTDTPAGDSIPNLLKYASALPALTSASTAELLDLVEDTGAGTFAIIYYKSKSAIGVTLEPIWASTLTGPWLTTGITLQKLADVQGREQWKASILKDQQGFMRLRATAQ